MPERPTIALVAHGVHDGGGMERALYELVSRAHNRYRFVVVAAKLDERLRPYVEWRRVRVPMRPIPLQLLCFALLASMRLFRLRGAIVHTQGAIIPNRADLATVQFCSAAYVTRTGGLATPGNRPLRRLNSSISRLIALAFERWCYRPQRLRLLAPVSTGVQAELGRHFPAMPTTITPNGVDCDRFRPHPENRRALRAAEGLADDDLVVLFVGGDWRRKGLPIVLQAVAATENPLLTIWVVGRGDREELAKRARELGIRLRCFGERADAERFYQAADVFVLPTLYETFSLVSYEAAASGLPVVATPTSGIDELVGDGAAGIAVERDAAHVARALQRLAADPALRRTLGAVGRERAKAFGWSRSVDSVVAAYDELARSAP